MDHAAISDSAPSTRCRILLVVAQFAVAWAYAISITGGFVVELGPLRISSRNANNPLLLALLAMGAAWILAPAGRRGSTMLAESTWLASALNKVVAPWIPSRLHGRYGMVVAALLAGTVASVGVFRGAFIAGSADSYGYVSQAHLWLSGTLRVPLPQVGELPEGVRADAFAPLGYRVAPDGASLVPTYSPGLPLQMAMFDRMFGPGAMFYVMPLLGGVAVWATYLLGTRVAGTAAGVIAALLLATSPAFVLQLTHAPMSDIPAMAWWTVALVLLLRSSRIPALLAGAAAGVAILTRPNLAPLMFVPGAFLIWKAAAKRVDHPVAVHRLLLFGIGLVPACLLVAYLNNYWYGSPLTSGYGSLAGLYGRQHFWTNVADFSRRLLASQGPLVLAAVAAPALLWRRRESDSGPVAARSTLVLCIAFAIGVYLCYAFYVPLDTWWTLRFLFPAFPIIFVFLSVALLSIPARLPPTARWLVVVTLVGLVVSHAIAFGRNNYAFDSTDEQRYADVGRYIAQKLPDRAVLFAVLHSGSARHYSGRLTVRYDYIAPELLEATIEHFRTRGFIPYFLLDAGEKREFVERFSPTTRLGTLDWQPVAVVHAVALYDPADAPRRAAR